MLVYYKADPIIISLQINLYSPWYSWKTAELALNNNYSLTLKNYILQYIVYIIEPTIYHTRGSTLIITPSMRFKIFFCNNVHNCKIKINIKIVNTITFSCRFSARNIKEKEQRMVSSESG
jgi:hypothetical protein